MKSKNILVTGGSGFIGSHIITRLLSQTNAESNKIVLLYHHEKPINFQQQKNVIAIQGDINDYKAMCEIISKHEIQTIYHMASNSIVRKCANDPLNAYLANVMGTVTLLEAVRNVGMNTVKKIIISTSDKVYGHAPHPYTEETQFIPKYTYEATKSCQDIVSQNYFFNYGLPINIIRCSNIYGPSDPNVSRLIPNVIRSINRGENPKLNSGVKDYIREFVHVDDVVDAIFLIEDKAENGEAYCVGGTKSLSVMALIETICEIMGHENGIDIVEKPNNFQEVEEQSIDSRKLRKLGWVAKYKLDAGLKECVVSPHYK
jgi:nucleoside-diphosphate-sugar epimerase